MNYPYKLSHELSLRPLPERVISLFETLNIPPRLVAHHLLVHNIAAQLVEAIQNHWPHIDLDVEAVLVGGVWHDIGKVKHSEELTGSEHQHEVAGLALLQQLGIEQRLTRFALTHGAWSDDPSVRLEDLLVALADHVWRGKRSTELEQRIVNLMMQGSVSQPWEIFIVIDDLIAELAEDADHRLSWQQDFPEK